MRQHRWMPATHRNCRERGGTACKDAEDQGWGVMTGASVASVGGGQGSCHPSAHQHQPVGQHAILLLLQSLGEGLAAIAGEESVVSGPRLGDGGGGGRRRSVLRLHRHDGWAICGHQVGSWASREQRERASSEFEEAGRSQGAARHKLLVAERAMHRARRAAEGAIGRKLHSSLTHMQVPPRGWRECCARGSDNCRASAFPAAYSHACRSNGDCRPGQGALVPLLPPPLLNSLACWLPHGAAP